MNRQEHSRAAEQIAALNPEWLFFKVAGLLTDWVRLSHRTDTGVDVTKGWADKAWVAWRGDTQVGGRFRSPSAAIRALGYKIKGN